ncbi:hypothetical protein PQI66_00275 [Corynebacterium sp. USCH3]|uniref:hypothetical protein n=1 Tax=Corynebacterium sp. USCH3 TaxID=3024840 RepID=UPI0030AD1810
MTHADTTDTDARPPIPAWPDYRVQHIDDDVTGGVRVVVDTHHAGQFVGCALLLDRIALATALPGLVGETEAICIASIAQQIEQYDSEKPALNIVDLVIL